MTKIRRLKTTKVTNSNSLYKTKQKKNKQHQSSSTYNQHAADTKDVLYNTCSPISIKSVDCEENYINQEEGNYYLTV